MKYLFLGIIGFLLSCSSGDKKQTASNDHISTEVVKSNNTLDQKPGVTENMPIMTFEETEFDFGVIHEGDKVEHEFKFTNTGTVPLIISGTSASCGCTVGSYSKEPIQPGETSVIKVTFNSSGKHSGPQVRNVYITANTEPNRTQVALTGEII